jgi:ATP-dependent Clp protease ATP-binding subunit ClpA
MLELEHDLEKRLKQSRVRIDTANADTLFLRNVPAHKDCFNKPRTNLLIKRPCAGLPFLVCVDEDLEYTGTDNRVLRAFSGAHRQQGWRVIYLEQATQEDARAAVNNALRVLGFDGEEPVLESREVERAQMDVQPGRLLTSFGIDITARVSEGVGEPTIGREDKIAEVTGALLQWQTRLPVVKGKSGVGKTNLLYGVARRLKELRPTLSVVAVDLGTLMAGTLFESERENLLYALLGEAATATDLVLVLEHLELALHGESRGPLLLAQALEQGLKLVGTVLDARLLEPEPLARRTQVVELTEPWPEELTEMLLALRERIAQHHRVRIDEEIVQAAIAHAQSLAGCMPAKVITPLDAAAVKASLAGSAKVSLQELYCTLSMFPQSAVV